MRARRKFANALSAKIIITAAKKLNRKYKTFWNLCVCVCCILFGKCLFCFYYI